jgi:pimeloyl-ACP methyl ester carboxylesterase
VCSALVVHETVTPEAKRLLHTFAQYPDVKQEPAVKVLFACLAGIACLVASAPSASASPPGPIGTQNLVVNGVAVTKYFPITPLPNRPPVVLVHGGMHGRWSMDFHARTFAEYGLYAYTLDWLNHGDSIDLPTTQFINRSIVEVAHREIRDVVNYLGVAPILVGHSMGGLAALAYATSYPVHKLLLMAPVVPSNVGAPTINIPVDLTAPFPVFPFDTAKQLFYTTMPVFQATHWHNLLVPESPRAVWEATRWTVQLNLAALAVAQDVLVVAAQLDQITPASTVNGLSSMIGGTYRLATNLGHCDILANMQLSHGLAQWALQDLQRS